MATISFFSSSFGLNNLNGSGLGFFGAAFGTSVEVAAYNTTTWITDGNGTIQGPQADNCRWTHPSSGSLNEAATQKLRDMPNHLTSLNIRFTHTSAIKTQNSKLRIYDRSNINNNPSGVTCKVAEIIHPSTTQAGELGSGDTSWLTPVGSAVIMDLVASPGMSGLRPNGANTTDTRHDYFVNISPSPDSIGSKLFGLYVELEYL